MFHRLTEGFWPAVPYARTMVNGTVHPRVVAFCTHCETGQAAIQLPTGEVLAIGGHNGCRACGLTDFRVASESTT